MINMLKPAKTAGFQFGMQIVCFIYGEVNLK